VNQQLASPILSAQEVQAFRENGFHIHGKLFSEEEAAAIRAACAQVLSGEYETGKPPDDIYWRPGDNPQAMQKIDNAWKANSVIARAVTKPELGHIAAQLLGAPSIRLWQDQISFKPGSGGKTVTWHQDWAYWQMITECQTITCWIALDDVLPESGPMVFLAGSQALGLYQRPPTISGDDAFKPMLPNGVALPEVPVVIPTGHVSFHHGLMLHGSDINRSGQPRRALVSHVISGECTYRERNEHINERAMRHYEEYPQAGEHFHGPQFPVIWPAHETK
jgi:ectoine hydroxylase-related dioxygenase (phytanoyl-CoA dioxygenase family)